MTTDLTSPSKTERMLAVEAAHDGRPIEELMTALLETDSKSTVARGLGISRATLDTWLLKLGIEVEHNKTVVRRK